MKIILGLNNLKNLDRVFMKSRKMKQHIYRYCSGLSVGYWKILLVMNTKISSSSEFQIHNYKKDMGRKLEISLLYLSNKNGILGNIT